jgi:DNA-binding PadR family transcriptional regulator
MFGLSNAEYLLLALLREREATSGYALNAMISERGYREWADVGMTSVYVGLKKLATKGLVHGRLATDKTTQGPAAKEFSLTEKGRDLLLEETAKGLSETRERDRRFDLALSSADVLTSEAALESIQKRTTFLESEQKRISDLISGQEQLISFTGALIFKHTLHLIRSEIGFLKDLGHNWDKETAFDH